MKNLHLSIRFACSFAFLLICAFATQAQQRVFVSGTGDDLNPCTRTLPCRNFQRGHDAVAAGGEVVVLDSAGYGQVTITKSVTITGDGGYAGITASSGNGITINTAGITVNLRSLTIEGLASGNGIDATDFAVLHIENCIINRFGGRGIAINPSAEITRKVFIRQSIVRNNGNAGIMFGGNGSGTALIATVEGTEIQNSGYSGIHSFGAGTSVTVHDCLSSSNSFGGFESDIGAVMNIETCVASNNGTSGIDTNTGTVRVSNSTVTNNAGLGFRNFTGTFESRGNNTLAGNNGGGSQTGGPITPLTAL